ncbi:MAG: DUF2184 domain-containing protein [Lachnospiraceae bacterium]
MKQYNMDDYRTLKGSNLIKGIAGSANMRFDSTEAASVFFARELDQVKTKTYDKQYPELSALANFPITSEVNEGAETMTFYSYDIAGMAEIINNYATDLPRVDVKGESHTADIRSIGDSYGYNVQEMRASRMAGKSLDARKGAAARRAADYLVNKIAFSGDKKHNLIGIFSEENDIPVYTLSTVTIDGVQYTDWAHKKPDQILDDINGMQKFIDKITMSIEKPDTLALPSYIYMDLATRRIPETETTVLSFLKEHAPYLKNFESFAELQDTATDINVSGLNVAFMYTKNAEKFSLEMPLPFYQYPLQVTKLETEVPCEARTAGLIIYYPLSMLLAYGI